MGLFSIFGPPPTIVKAIQAFSVISIKKRTCKKNPRGAGERAFTPHSKNRHL